MTGQYQAPPGLCCALCAGPEVVVNAGGNAALVFTSPLWKTTRACQVTRLFDREEDEHARSALLAVYDESQAACRELELGKMARSPM